MKYTEEKSIPFFKFSYFLVGLPMSIVVQYSVLLNVPIRYLNHQYSEVFFGCLIFAGMFLLEYTCLIAIHELFSVAVVVELTEETIIGFSLIGKRRWEMRYDAIVEISPKQMGWSFRLVDMTGNKIFISVYVNPLSSCMETIQIKAVNAKKIDFGRYKNNPKI